MSFDFGELLRKLRLYIVNFNIFPSIPPTEDQYELRSQRISTRLFIVLLVLSLTTLILYTSLINITQTVNVDSPTMAQYIQLYSTYPQTLSCDCRQISINYDTFVHLDYSLHQICSSVFTTQEWFDYMLRARPLGFLYNNDFRASGRNVFQTLRAFCDLTSQTIDNRLTQFYASQFVSSSVVSEELFELQIQAFISQFISSTTSDFLLSLSSIRQITQSNLLLPALQTNFMLYIYSSSYILPLSYKYGNCSCATTPKCKVEYSIMNGANTTILFIVPGMYFGCYAVESLLQSDLRCFYNRTCISEIQSYLNGSTPINFKALDPNVSVGFNVNSTLEDILDKLMVEQCYPSITYESYYNECAPSQCNYMYETKNSAIYIITTIIGLIGGLITILKLIFPSVVSLVRRRRQRQTREAASPEQENSQSNVQLLKECIERFNIFPSIPPTEDQYELRSQRISTRLFIVLLALSLTILILYTSLINITQTVNVDSPTMAQYLQLYSTYPQTLSCDCRQISINYDTFVHLNYSLHQICSSVFTTQKWFDYIHSARSTTTLYLNDFRIGSTYIFQALQAFCNLSDQTIQNRLSQFYSIQYVSAFVVSSQLFKLQI
ncbi:unnamed protein product [Adineta ricciae]|uniref:Transmembrane protein n=1 Tax=Adineta ricciae TaxID=249248 RepID=A0A815RYM8_ADIRI|nr:unnamed protein product [Adineta ricciae]CAF1615449.1 unnamed protein product [Adineta ricciae]